MMKLKRNLTIISLTILAIGCSESSTNRDIDERYLPLGEDTIKVFSAYYQNDEILNATLGVSLGITKVLASGDDEERTSVAELKKSIECLNKKTSFLSRDMDFINSVMLSEKNDSWKLKSTLDKHYKVEASHNECENLYR